MTKKELTTLTEKVKNALRISTNSEIIKEEIEDNVKECIEDLKRSGVVVDLNDPLILKACKCYAKAFFGYDENQEKYQESYKSIKIDLANRGTYSG